MEWVGGRQIRGQKKKKTHTGQNCVCLLLNCDFSTQNDTEKIVNLSRFVSNRKKVERGNEGGKEGEIERREMNAG